MSKQRFYLDKNNKIHDKEYEYQLVIGNILDTEEIVDLLNKFHKDIDSLIDENMALREDGTRLKLVMTQIIEDLENTDNDQYINWIKDNCNINLYSQNDIQELKNINRKRTYDYRRSQLIIKEALSNATHSIEYTTILRLSKLLGIDILDS